MTAIGPDAPRQLALRLGLSDAASFENFHPANNERVMTALQGLAADSSGRQIYLWGGGGSGKTHLLQAVVRYGAVLGRPAAYLPLGDLSGLGPEVLEGFERAALVCIDDVHRVAAQPEWEQALFGLYNRLSEERASLVVAADGGPRGLAIRLEDLRSRLMAMATYRLHPLGDEDKIAALRLRASRRGLELPEASARYLLKRQPRDCHSLFATLDGLDQASLAAQRRLTIAFLKRVSV